MSAAAAVARRWLAVVLAAWALGLGAAEPSSWRVYRAGDGLAESFSLNVTLSPRGTVWVRHRELNLLSSLDGYRVRAQPAPRQGVQPVYESRAGQVWAAHPEGLLELVRGQWVLHAIPEVQSEVSVGVSFRGARTVPILPGDYNRVWLLLSDRLLEYEAGTNRARVVRMAGDTGLGRFLNLGEARDGGVWVSGERGLGRVVRGARRQDRTNSWEEFLLPAGLGLRNLDRPFEDAGGVVVALAERVEGEGRAVVVFGEAKWEVLAVPAERPRGVWRDGEGGLWLMTRNAIWRHEDGEFKRLEEEWTAAGQFYDVAAATNGVFWVATSEGLVRHAPQPWGDVERGGPVGTAVHSLAEDEAGQLWVGSASGLFVLEGSRWRQFPWPSDYEASFQPADRIACVGAGRVVVGGGGGVLLFDLGSQQFRRVVHPERRVLRGVRGQVRDRGVLLFSHADGATAGAARYQVDLFDGEAFHPVFQAAADWGLGDDLSFVNVGSDQAVWIGGNEGLMVFREGRFRKFGVEEGFGAQRALCLAEVGRGRIWCGSGDLIFEYDGRVWQALRSGFERVNGIWRGMDDSVWVAAGSGLHRYRDGSWVGIATDEGLPGTAVHAVIEDRLGRMWAGTSRGLGAYRPLADVDPPRTQLARRDLPAEVSTEEGVSVALRGVDKWKGTLSHRLLFSYRLDQGSWSPYAGANVLVFPSLTAGPHRLEVRAMDRNWNRELEPAVHEFLAVLPWYQEPRLVGLGVAAGFVTLFLAAFAVNRHLRLLRSHAEVERIVAERTRQLERANSELLHSQKMTALGTLAAGVAHDFNNILSIVKGSAQIIEANPGDSEKVRTRIQRIQTVVDQGAGVVRALLGLSRAGREGLVVCDANVVVAETVRLLGDRFLQEVQVEVEPAEGLPGFVGAPDLLQQMLLNLIINAADAMGGEGRVIVRTGRLDTLPGDLALAPAAAPGHVFISVQDFGTGISPEVRARIFEPFFTTKAMSSRRGTGLGLSMVYELSRQLGFGLKVESEVGRGTVFTVYMPESAAGVGVGVARQAAVRS